MPPAYRYGMMPLFAIAVLFIVLAPTFWNETQVHSGSVGEASENADLYQFYYPAYHYAFDRLRHGSLPLWNPRQLCGAPLMVDPRVGVLQPLNFPFMFLPTERALAVHTFVCLFLMGLFFTLFARAVGVGYLAAALGGMAYAFSGFSAAAMSRPPLAAALVWTPLVLWAVREYAYRFDTATAVVAGMAGALLVLSGSYALALSIGVISFVYAAQSLVFVERGSAEFSKRLRGLFIIFPLALGASAAQWLPALVYFARIDGPLEHVWGPAPVSPTPADLQELLSQFVVTSTGTQPRAAYLGVLPLLFAPVGLFHRQRRRDAILFALIGVVFALLIGFFGWRLPFRFPFHALLFPIVVIAALLTSIGADRVFTPRKTFRSPSIWLPVTIWFVVFAALFIAFGADVRRYAVPCAVAVLLFAPLRFRGLAPLCYAGLGAILFIDLANAGRTVYTHPQQDAPRCFETYIQALDTAREQVLGGRAFASARELDRGLTPNHGMLSALDMAGGGWLPLTVDQARWWARLNGSEAKTRAGVACHVTPEALSPQLLRYMAARLLIAAPQSALYDGAWKSGGPRLREIAPVAGVRLFVMDDALPRAYWVSRARVEVGMPATLDVLCDPMFDNARTCVVDAQSQGIAALAQLTGAQEETDSGAPVNATCSVEDITPERVVVRVNAPREGVTILSDSFDPGWTATLDGVRQPILKVNGIFRGMATPAGTHEIVFSYRPWSVYIGLAASSLILLAAFAYSIGTLAKPG